MSAGLDYFRGMERPQADASEWRHRLHPQRCPDHGHDACTAHASWQPPRQLHAVPDPAPRSDSWAEREDDTWIDRM